jgi:hypothetical membrane protein
MKLLLMGGVAGPVIFTIVTIAAAAEHPAYDSVRQFISELGAHGAQTAALMNHAGFLPAGVMIAAFGIGLKRFLPKSLSNTIFSLLVCAFGTGVAAEGMISCDPGCPQGSGTMENIVHNALAPMIFLCAIAAMIGFGVRWRKDLLFRRLSVYSAVSGLLALLALAALASSLEARDLTGLWQRILLLLIFSWCGVVSTFTTVQSWRTRAA